MNPRPFFREPFRRAVPLAMAALLTAIGAGLTTWPLPRAMGTATLRSGEVLLTAWQLDWYHHALLSNPLAWADANIFFPYDGTAAFNDLLMTHALLTLPWAAAASPVVALNVALLGGIVLCAVCTWLLVVELVDEPWAAAVAGILFALAPYRFLQIGHLSIAAAWPVPLFFWALLRHLRQPSWARAAVASASGLLVGLSSLYYAAYVAPIAPLLLLFGARRGPGGRAVWAPLAATGLPAIAALAWFVVPFAEAMRVYGSAAAPDDLLTYGADLASVAQKPEYLTRTTPAIGAEGHLYPGAGLAWLALGGVLLPLTSLRTWPARQRQLALAGLAIAGALVLGALLPAASPLWHGWRVLVLTLVWTLPLAFVVWAVAGTNPRNAVGADSACRLGIAGAAVALVLALGPEARLRTEPLGPAPYWLLTRLSAAFEGTRVPARFGSLALLFLAVLAAATLTRLLRAPARSLRLLGVAAAVASLVACAAQMPLPRLPRGQALVDVPPLDDPAYRWLAARPGIAGILELPDWAPDADVDYRVREYRSLHYMLASKQHFKPLVNGTGRIEPFLWQRFRSLAPWSDEFFTYITAYFPVDYVLVHENGIPLADRTALWTRLGDGGDGWRELHRSAAIRVYAVDRSFGRGAVVDRLMLRRDLAPSAAVRFEARIVRDARAAAAGADASAGTLDVLRDGEVVGACALDATWRSCQASSAIPGRAADPRSEWPATTTLFRLRLRGMPAAAFEIRSLAIERARADGE